MRRNSPRPCSRPSCAIERRRAPAEETTEYHPGTYVYNDRSLMARRVCGCVDCALTVPATVVSVPSPNRAIIDAGNKVLASDRLGISERGHVLGRPDIAIDPLSEERDRLVSAGPIGNRLRIVANHACAVNNMVDTVRSLEHGAHADRWPVVARGKTA